MDEPFVVNVAGARTINRRDRTVKIELEPEEGFPETGINITILQPGKPNGKYHAESTQEDFLVLHGECLLLIEGEERRLKAWDFVHCPPGTDHIFVGLAEPCAVLMIGARREHGTIVYPVSDLAASYGASVAKETTQPAEAYADWPDVREPVDQPWPLD